jgi:Spo0E like sporulation regulatory protein
MKKVELEEAINEKRAEMIEIGMAKGLSCEETIVCSQELDRLLNEYRRLTVKQGSSKPSLILDDLFASVQYLVKLISRPYRFMIPFKSNRLS